MSTIAKPKKSPEAKVFKYACKCGETSERSIGNWRVQCNCGRYMECPKAPWEKPPMSPAEQLKAYREKQKYSQELLASIIGISQGMLSAIESEEKPLTPEVAKLIRKNIPGLGL